MNFGSSTQSRFELETTTQGKQGIFFLPKENKSKNSRKFGYKEKNLKNPIRKTNKIQEVPVEEISKKSLKPDKNFIKKNRDRLGGRTTQNNKDQPLNSGTVTLTQNQLNAILESVGNLREGKENALRISIDPGSNEVKITSPRQERRTDKNSSRSEKSVKTVSNGGKLSEEERNILKLVLDKDKQNIEDKVKSDKDVENFKNEISARSEKGKNQKTTEKSAEKSAVNEEEKTKVELIKEVKESVLHLPPVPSTHLTVAEKKRLQWALEKGESENYDPWGRPGAGAPVRNNAGNVLADYKTRQEELKTSPERQGKGVSSKTSPRLPKTKPDEPVKGTLDIGQLSDPENLQSRKETQQRKLREDLEKQLEEKKHKKLVAADREKLDDTWANQLSHDYKPAPLPTQLATFVSTNNKNSPRKVKVEEILVTSESPSWLKEQKVPPAAMRSSFAFGGLDDTRYNNTKEEERKNWIKELEKQKEEKRVLTLTQKEKLKALDAADEKLWAEPVSPRFEKSSPRNNVKSSPHSDIGNSSMKVGDSARSSSAPEPPLETTLIRGQNVVIDPVTLKDLEEKRKRHIEYQAAIKSQIDEKKNNIRLEREKKWAEEQEEELKLKREREVIQKQFELEQQKLLEKEQVREQQLQQLKAAMDDAQERALHEKHLKRMHHLQQGGHDITNLKANYEVITPSPVPIGRSTVASVARQPTDKHYHAMTPRVQPVNQPTNVTQFNLSEREVDTSLVLRHSDSRPIEEQGQGHMIHHDDYVQDRVVTPFKQRHLSDPMTDPYSPRRHFGTQTITDQYGVKRELSEVKIEYKPANGEEVKNKNQSHKIKNLAAGNKTKKVRLKSGAQVKTFKPDKFESKEKLGWNYSNQRRTKLVKNSEKDPFYEEKKRESQARHSKRSAQLYKMIEANKAVIPTEHPPGSRDTSPRRYKSLSPNRVTHHSSPRLDRSLSPHIRSETRLVNPSVSSPRGHAISPPVSYRSENRRSRMDDHRATMGVDSLRSEHHKQGRSPPVPAVKHRRQHHADLDEKVYDNQYDSDLYNYNNYNPKTGHSNQKSHYTDTDPVCPPVNDNDFIPFTRTTEVLDPSYADEPISVSRENTRVTKGRKAYRENQQPANYGNKIDNYEDKNQKDPMFNPGLVTDHPTSRQDQILLQLSNLKQNLMQKQRELETCMSPSAFDQQ